MKDVHQRRCFLASFFTTLCLILLTCGIILVDYQTGRVALGEQQPMILVRVAQDSATLQVHVLGTDVQWDVTAVDQWIRRAEDTVVAAVDQGQELLRQIPLQKAYKSGE